MPPVTAEGELFDEIGGGFAGGSEGNLHHAFSRDLRHIRDESQRLRETLPQLDV